MENHSPQSQSEQITIDVSQLEEMIARIIAQQLQQYVPASTEKATRQVEQE